MNVALIGPELEENLGLRYIHASLVKGGFTAGIFDFHDISQVSGLVRKLSDENPDVVGLSMVFTARGMEFIELARQLRRAGYGGHITAGGHFASCNAVELLSDFAEIDSVVHGEGERTMVDLVGNLNTPESVTGISYRDIDGQVCKTQSRRVADIDDLSWPTRDKQYYAYMDHPIASILSGRGCYGNCSFCSIRSWYGQSDGPIFRQRSVQQVVAEMACLYHDHGVRMFNFHDDNFFLPKEIDNLKRFDQMKEMLDKAGVGKIALQVKARPDSVYSQSMERLREIGLFRVFLGVESNSVAGLKALGRGINRQANRLALETLLDMGLHVTFNLLMFEPDCTIADLRDNIRLIREFDRVPLNFCRTEVYSGTPLERRLRKQGRLLGDYHGFNYRISDPRSQAAFVIFRNVFMDRNFTLEGMNHRGMSLDYNLHVLGHFHSDRVSIGLRTKAKNFLRDLNGNNAELLERIMDFVSGQSIPGENDLKAFTAALTSEREEFDKAMTPVINALLWNINDAAESRDSRVSRTMSRIASAAAALVMVTAMGCDNKSAPPHPSEMAPSPKQPKDPELRTLNKDEIKIVQKKIDSLSFTRISEVGYDHGLEGRAIGLEMRIAEGGRVGSIEIDKPHGKVKADLWNLMKTWVFPDIKSPGRCSLEIKFMKAVPITVPTEPAHHPSEMAPHPAEMIPVPREIDPHPAEMVPGPIENRTHPTERTPIPTDTTNLK